MSVSITLKVPRWDSTGTSAITGFGIYHIHQLGHQYHTWLVLTGVGTIKGCKNKQEAQDVAQADYFKRQKSLFRLLGLSRRVNNDRETGI